MAPKSGQHHSENDDYYYFAPHPILNRVICRNLLLAHTLRTVLKHFQSGLGKLRQLRYVCATRQLLRKGDVMD
jgi:hypothetical protein